MKNITLFIFLPFLLLGVDTLAQEVGEKVYKEIIIDNDGKIGKWFEVKEIKRYDENGKIVYENPTMVGGETWYEYDSKGNQIHMKSEKRENWKKYNDNGQVIFEKWQDGKEYWYEYDLNGNEIHIVSNDDFEKWKEYDEKGNIIHERTNSWMFDEHWYEYNSKDNLIHEKWNHNDYFIIESWYEYNSKGKLIHKKRSDDIESWYEYNANGNLVHEKHVNKLIGNEEYWYDTKGKPIHSKKDEREWWSEYDDMGNEVHRKYLNSGELWVKYDKRGNIIYVESSPGDKKIWFEYDYDYWGNGKLKKQIQYKSL
jgi:YD repeat-containing protein